ncbi:MAG: hypothetical protein QN651_02830, partial [Nitrososphaeraceae archaeon]|nr:hypothetical protein [Nitrososphaeraceae archaeon]
FVNIVGDAEEPICDYRTCRHKLSEHYPSSRICRCSHPSNKAIGIRLSTTAQVQSISKSNNKSTVNQAVL